MSPKPGPTLAALEPLRERALALGSLWSSLLRRGRPVMNKPPPLNRDNKNKPTIQTPKGRWFMHQGSALDPNPKIP